MFGEASGPSMRLESLHNAKPMKKSATGNVTKKKGEYYHDLSFSSYLDFSDVTQIMLALPPG